MARHPRFPATAASLALALLLAGCGIQVERIPIATPLPVPEAARPVPMRFGKMQVRLRRGEPVQDREVWSLDCEGPYDQFTWTRGRTQFDRLPWSDLFNEELRASGYDVTGDPARMHDEDEEEMRAEWVVSAQITELRIKSCAKAPLLFGLVWRKGVTAEASVGIDWTVYSRLDRRLVMRARTGGWGEADSPTEDGDMVAVEQAFAAAVANLAADPAFHAAAFERRAASAPPPRSPDAPAEEAPGAPPGTLSLPRLAPREGPLAGRAEAATAAAVTISGGAGHGSGALVSPEGWILTNAHVVGEAERVRVRLADGRVLVGRVARRHPTRDVALVKVDGQDLPALPIRERPLAIGEDVHAVGAPGSERLHTTLTRGIVSAFRREALTRMPVVQADVAVYPGSSGGPLLDGSGNLVGLTVAGYGAGTMLNLFIPVADALDKLEVSPAPSPWPSPWPSP